MTTASGFPDRARQHVEDIAIMRACIAGSRVAVLVDEFGSQAVDRCYDNRLITFNLTSTHYHLTTAGMAVLALADAEKIVNVSTAEELLAAAAQHMCDRAANYDQPGGERSMARTIAAFNAINGASLTTADGWLIMALLKIVRAQTGRGTSRKDSVEDFPAYAALFGEAIIAEAEQAMECSK